MEFLAVDSPIMKFFGRIGDILVLNLIFVISCVPIFTIGTAIVSLYAVAMKLVRGEELSITKEYWKAYKGNLKKATAVWGIMAAIGILIFFDFRFIRVLGDSGYFVMKVILGIILGMYLLTFLYLFPYIARFENSYLNIFRNSFLLSAAHIPSTILMLGISLGVLFLTLATSKTFVIGTIVWFFAGFAAVAYINSFLLCKIFSKYE